MPSAESVPDRPVNVPLRGVAIRGKAEIRATTGGDWQPLVMNQIVEQTSELRTLGRGGVFSLAGKSGDATLWLRGDSHVRLSHDKQGTIYVTLLSGDARIDFADSGLTGYAVAGKASLPAQGRDLLLSKPRSNAGYVAMTSTRPRQAEWSLELDDGAAAAGFGSLELAGAAAGDASAAVLELRRVWVDVQTQGDLAVTSVEHIFFNASDARHEGTFRFPMPDGAMLQGLAMEIDGRLMEGEIVEKEKARRTYESIVDSMQDPALLEWEQGNWFKLRVFPIEPNSEKRVIIRYAAPLTRGVDGWEYVFTAAAPDMQKVGELELVFNGQSVHKLSDLSGGKDLVVRVDDASVATATREARPDGIYTAVRIRPDWSRLSPAAKAPGTSRSILVIVDTSRSSLEGRALALETLTTVLGQLDASDRFQIMASDVGVRMATGNMVPVSEQNIASAVTFIEAIEPDGASDLAAALEAAGKTSATEVVYIGDGTPTWGVTDDGELAELAARALDGKQLHAAVIGKGADSELWTRITGRLGGYAARPRTPMQAKKMAFFLAHAHAMPRLSNVAVTTPGASAPNSKEAGDDISLYPHTTPTLFAGDELVVVMRTGADKPAPHALAMTAELDGKPIQQTFAIADAKPARFVSQRWAIHKMAELEADGADKEIIVAFSKDFGVLSKHTSLLVLESEEAYKEHQIERRRAQQQLAQQSGDPTVTGGDLESLSGRRASLSPDHIQPGDPEIRIPAPADARSVVVVFPFGDTKLAEYDEELGAWMVRFLIDKDTPDGKYLVNVTITHADGRIQTLKLPYFVDTRPPEMQITARKLRNGSYVITARQRRSKRDLVRKDAHRVEVLLPNGETMFLEQKAWGKFAKVWAPDAALTGPVTLKVVVTDRALNQASVDLVIDPGLDRGLDSAIGSATAPASK